MARASAYSGESYHAFACSIEGNSTIERWRDGDSPSTIIGSEFETIEAATEMFHCRASEIGMPPDGGLVYEAIDG